MTTHPISQSVPASFLRRAIRADATFSTASGLVMTLGARPVAALLGVEGSSGIVAGVGGVLLLWGLLLFFQTRQNEGLRPLAWSVIAMNELWVIATIVGLATGWLPFSTSGQWLAAIAAVIVAAFAGVQFYALRQE